MLTKNIADLPMPSVRIAQRIFEGLPTEDAS
jgi:hypothetical protein